MQSLKRSEFSGNDFIQGAKSFDFGVDSGYNGKNSERAKADQDGLEPPLTWRFCRRWKRASLHKA